MIWTSHFDLPCHSLILLIQEHMDFSTAQFECFRLLSPHYYLGLGSQQEQQSGICV